MTGPVLTPPRRSALEVVRLDQPDDATMALIRPHLLREFKPEDLYVRRAYIAHDAVDTYWSQLEQPELQTAARLLPGVPVLEMHGAHSGRPQARTFRGEMVHRPDTPQRGLVDGIGTRHWLAGDFWWMRGHSRADDLALEIDGGMQREVSLRWKMEKPVCSIDGDDMRDCAHMPGDMYDGKRAYYKMKGVVGVREWSFVDRGGQLGTELQLAQRGAPADWTPTRVVDEYLKTFQLDTGEEERAGLIEFARCYDANGKLSKNERADRGWFDVLPATRAETDWFGTFPSQASARG